MEIGRRKATISGCCYDTFFRRGGEVGGLLRGVFYSSTRDKITACSGRRGGALLAVERGIKIAGFARISPRGGISRSGGKSLLLNKNIFVLSYLRKMAV